MSLASLGDASADEPRGTRTWRRWGWILVAFFAAAAVLVAVDSHFVAAAVFLVIALTSAIALVSRRAPGPGGP